MPIQIAEDNSLSTGNTENTGNTESCLITTQSTFTMDAHSSYCVNSDLEFFNGTAGDLCFYLNEANVNVLEIDRLINNEVNDFGTSSYTTLSTSTNTNSFSFNWSTPISYQNFSGNTGGSIRMTGSLFNTLRLMQDHWYENEATPLEKSTLFYKFLFEIGSQLDELVNNFYEIMEDLNVKLDARNTFDNCIRKLNAVPDTDTDDDTFGDSRVSIKLDRARKMAEFIVMVKDKLTLYRSNVTHTFDECMRARARVRIEETSANNLIIQERLNNMNIDNNDNNEPMEVSGDFIGSYGTASWDDNIRDTLVGHARNSVRRNVPKIDYKKKKIEKKRTRRMLNKSIENISTFLPKKDIHAFISSDGFELQGTYFNYKIYKKKQYKLLQKESDTSNIHIPYMLDLLDKNNEYIANLCITFNGCPILDQILSVYLMISSGQEKEMLEKCNFYSKSELYNTDTNLIELLGDRHRVNQLNGNYNNERRNSFLTNLDNTTIETINGSIPEDNINTNPSGGEIYNINSNWVVGGNSITMAVTNDKEKFKKYFMDKLIRPMLGDLYDFTYNTEPSWDEVEDYYSISLDGNPDLEFGNGGPFSDGRLDFISIANNAA